MSKIIVITPEKCLGFDGAFTVYEGLGILPEVTLQTFESFKPSSDTKLVISLGYSPPRIGNYKTSFIFCSPILQCESSGELGLLNEKIKEISRGVLDYLFILHEQDAIALRSIWGERILTMFPLFNKQLPEPQLENRKGICCGGHVRGNKNYYNQALGFSISKYTEEGFFSFGLKPQLTNLSRSLFKQDLNVSDYVLSNDLYYERLRKMKLGLQVSLSESFCYFVLELCLLKIPSIVSRSIRWYSLDPELEKYCVVNNPDDPVEISEKINNILGDSELYQSLCEISCKVAQETLSKNLEKTKEVLGKLI